MITGASRADAALLVIDAREGICENSRRHAYMLSMLGIKQIAVLINKLDLIPETERQAVFNTLSEGYAAFLSDIGMTASYYIPVSAALGDNIAKRSAAMPWYEGATVLEALDGFTDVSLPGDLPLRLWVQDVYKFTASGDERRIVAGTVSSGTLCEGDEILLLPSGKKTVVKSIEGFNEPPRTDISAGYATGFQMTEQIYIKRGELVSVIGQTPPVTGSRFTASVFWLGRAPLVTNKTYKLKLGTLQTGCRIEEFLGVLDASTLENTVKDRAERFEVARCVFHLDRPAAFDVASGIPDTGRFVLVDDYEITGGGIITEALSDADLGDKLNTRNIKWHKSAITAAERAAHYGQKAQLLLITGASSVDKKSTARKLEKLLLESGKIAYYLGIGNMLYGVDADIKSDRSRLSPEERGEHIRRLGEIANLILDAGNILIITASDLTSDELDTLRRIIRCDEITTVKLGETGFNARDFDLCFAEDGDENIAEKLLEYIKTNNRLTY